MTDFDSLWNYDNPEETEKKFREILPEVKASGDKSAYLQLMTQIARTLGLQMKFDEAHRILDETDPQITDEFKLARVRYLLERGRAYNSSKKIDRAREMFLKAFELSRENGFDNFTVDAAHMLGITESGEDSLKWNETAMEIAENSQDKKANGWLGSLYNNTGWTFHDMKDYRKALEIFEKNVKWHNERKNIQKEIIAKWCVGRTLRSLDRIDEAMEIHRRLLEEIKEKNLEEDGYIYEELGECNLIKGNTAESKKNFGIAYKMLSKDIWLAEYEKERLERMKKLSETPE